MYLHDICMRMRSELVMLLRDGLLLYLYITYSIAKRGDVGYVIMTAYYERLQNITLL